MAGHTRPCRGPHPGEDPPIVAGGWCPSCRRRLAQALDGAHPLGLPGLYVALVEALTPGSTAPGMRVSGSKSPPMPISAAPEALLRRILEVALCWAEVVRDTAGLADPAPRPVLQRTRLELVGRTVRDPAGAPVLEQHHVMTVAHPADSWAGYAVAQACRTLATHLDTLLGLPPVPVERRLGLGELAALPEDTVGVTIAGGAWVILELDGRAAAAELLECKRRARALLGQTRGKSATSPLPCPECSRLALVKWHGTDSYECEECHEEIPAGLYPRLVKRAVREMRRTQRQARGA